jgi:hypothetical protein
MVLAAKFLDDAGVDSVGVEEGRVLLALFALLSPFGREVFG